MFSATWPEEIQKLAKDFMNNAVHVQIGEMDYSKNLNIK
jgi:superfamily II DNA/RNA helicase